MKLSIIVPIYNAEKYLDECIQSVLLEMDNNVELLLINDGSKDSSLEICKKYEMQNVKVFSNENHGVSYSRNFGIEYARGDFLLFLDADDFLLKGWKRVIDKALATDMDVGYFTHSKMVTSKLDILNSMIGFPNGSLKNMAAVWSKVYKRSFILENHICFTENIINGEDELFNIQVILAAAKYIFINNNIYYYRVNEASVTHSFNEKFINSNDLFLYELKKTLQSCCFLSTEEVNKYLDFCFLNSLYILLIRIFTIKDKKERISKLVLLEREDYRLFLEYYTVNPQFGKRLNKLAVLLKKRKYASLFRRFKLKRTMKLMLGMVKG